MKEYLKKPAIACITLGLLGATAVEAQELTFAYGLDTVSDYVSEGVSQTMGKPAVQPSLFAFYGGLYGGFWGSNVDFGGPNDYEIDLYLGYYGGFENGVYYDLSYARYHYDDTGFDSAAILTKLGGPITSQVGVEGQLEYNLDYETFTKALVVNYNPDEKVSLSALYGDSEFYDHRYWSFGGKYIINDNVSIDVTYHGVSNSVFFDDAGAVATLSLKF